MADLSQPREAASWIASWRSHYASKGNKQWAKETLARRLRRAADEQSRNQRRYSPHDRKYRAAVKLLERAARSAEREALLVPDI
jgi:hypothetical protein